jgi:thioredoxin reductase (NADPH)
LPLHSEPGVDLPSSRPAILIVDADPDGRTAIEAPLRRRYGTDYRIVTSDSAEQGLRAYHELLEEPGQVAIVAVDLQLPGIDGLTFLGECTSLRARPIRFLTIDQDPTATRIPFRNLTALQHAVALGRIDYWIVKGSSSPEEWLYPKVQQALTAWTRSTASRLEVVRVVGKQWEPRSHEVRDSLARNTVPFGFYDIDSDLGAQLVQEHGIDTDRLPALVFRDGTILQDPDMSEIARVLAVRTSPSADRYDVAILGAGPAGLSASVYGASEGLSTIVLEPEAIGGQAGTSSMIRNYLGFPLGVGGGDLTFRAWEQALLFGAEFVFGQRGDQLTREQDSYAIGLSNGLSARATSIIVSSGVTYRRLGIPTLERLTGAGVYYGAAGVEAPAMTGEHVYVVGGANSAGQAAVYLAKFADQVTLLVRGTSLEASMSEYLITQIEATPNIIVRSKTRVTDASGTDRLRSLTLEDVETSEIEIVETAGVFIMIGADAKTEWLPPELERDARGFILAGPDVPRSRWPLQRAPLPFETSMPGVFAVGDVRHGSVKRVASAVGEGSVAIGSVHQYLAGRDNRTE